jgi:tetratricopeptide (TPR) repeat protein
VILSFSARVLAAAIILALMSVVSVQPQTRVAELNESGWKAIGRGDGARAATFFADALAVRPDDPVLLLGAGAAAHLRGRLPEATANLQQALALDPRLIEASRLLGAIAYSSGDLALAIATYEKALVHAPRNQQLAKELAAWRDEAEVHRGFEERRYDRFNVMYQGREDERLAADATRSLDAAFWRIGQKLGAYPADPVVVVLYTEKQFRDITRAPEWSGGQYDGRIRIPVAGASQKPEVFDRVLTHELTHAMVASLAPRGVPAWLHEGMAQYFEGGDLQAARHRVKARGRPVPLKLLEGPFGGLGAGDAAVAYDQSLAAVGLLFERPDFGWSRLLSDLASGEPFERAIVRFGFSYADLEAALAR